MNAQDAHNFVCQALKSQALEFYSQGGWAVPTTVFLEFKIEKTYNMCPRSMCASSLGTSAPSSFEKNEPTTQITTVLQANVEIVSHSRRGTLQFAVTLEFLSQFRQLN